MTVAGGMLSLWAPALGTALAQSLWQGAAAALALWAAQPWLRRMTARARYAAASAALFALPAGFAATLWLALHGGGAAIAWLPPIARGMERIWVPYVVAAWAAGAAGMGVYSALGWGLAQRLRRGASYAVPQLLREQLERLRQALGASRRTRIGISAAAPGPCVLGWWRPLILLPAGALAGMAPDQLEALLAHELAHIRRHDYLVNLAQRMVESVFFYHPAVWWISRQVTEEREHCCDDLAIAVCGDRMSYARALVDLAAQGNARVVRPFAAASLAATGGSLRRRIERIVNGAVPPLGGSRGAMFAGGMLLAAMAFAGLLAAAPRLHATPAAAPTVALLKATPTRLSPAPETAAAARMARSVSAAAKPEVQREAALTRLPRFSDASRRRIIRPPARDVAAAVAAAPARATTREKLVLAWAPTGMQACRPQVVMQPMLAADGRIWIGLRTVTSCQPVMRPVEVLVVTT
jgi:beta-lactamase regulating signal transducer with metallopeptidase domain